MQRLFHVLFFYVAVAPWKWFLIMDLCRMLMMQLKVVHKRGVAFFNFVVWVYWVELLEKVNCVVIVLLLFWCVVFFGRMDFIKAGGLISRGNSLFFGTLIHANRH